MIYIFDIMLNFNENYYKFYEWNEQDNIINYKKIPLFKINENMMEDIFNYNIKVEEDFLKILKGKNSNNNLSVIFTDSKEVIALIFDKKGNITKRSSVIIDDELEILSLSNNLKSLILNYSKEKELKKEMSSRKEKELKNNLINKIKEIDETGLIKYFNYSLLNIKSTKKEHLINYIENGNYWENKKVLSNIFEVLSIY